MNYRCHIDPGHRCRFTSNTMIKTCFIFLSASFKKWIIVLQMNTFAFWPYSSCYIYFYSLDVKRLRLFILSIAQILISRWAHHDVMPYLPVFLPQMNDFQEHLDKQWLNQIHLRGNQWLSKGWLLNYIHEKKKKKNFLFRLSALYNSQSTFYGTRKLTKEFEYEFWIFKWYARHFIYFLSCRIF